MSEMKRILDVWKRAQAAGDAVCLATVVGIEGSAYRRPGARMVLTAAGLRAGTVSGGCLEGEIAKKAWWLTEQGASVQRYSSFFDDDLVPGGAMPYGLGCGGTVMVLLERGAAAAETLEALRRSVDERTTSVIVTKVGAKGAGTVLILSEGDAVRYRRESVADARAEALAGEALRARTSRASDEFYVEYVAPPPALFVFGAGNDAQPLVEFAAELDWHVTVADGRAQLVRSERFPGADRVMGLREALDAVSVGDAAVAMTHSYDQDREVLRRLAPLGMRYLGILGPRRRTERLTTEIAGEMGLTVEECLARLHTPVGLDLGGHSPAAIALSIAAELQAVLAGREAKKLSVAKLIHV
jgi:xanthine/CO dehydrogenase XdhC/CoxF family maturation factor